MYINLPLQNIKLVDFSAIIKRDIETNIINDIDSYGLIKDDKINIKNKDVKRLFYHHIIHGLCEHVLNIKGKQKIVIQYSILISPTHELNQYICNEHIQLFFNSLINKLRSMLPIKFLITDESFSWIKRELKNDNGGKINIITKAKYIVDNFDISKYTFTKARYFAKRYELKYLSDNYFKKLKSKQLILS